jgi:hypothetical protein
MSSENNQESQPRQEATVEFVVPDPEGGIFTTYSNNVQVGFTSFDVRCVFGEVVDAQPGKIVVEQRAQITLSYLQAKMLVFMLHKAITEHEAVAGEIKIPIGALDVTLTSAQAKVPPGTITRGL